MLFNWFAKKPSPALVAGLYGAIVAQARQPVFYRDWQVADTVEGRYEMLCLHVFLIVHRLKGETGEAKAVSEALMRHFFSDMDGKLREIGTGDLAVPKKIKSMAEAFYGRIAAYDTALALEDNGFLADALKRNVFAQAQADAAPLCTYMRDAAALLAATPVGRILAADLPFPKV